MFYKIIIYIDNCFFLETARPTLEEAIEAGKRSIEIYRKNVKVDIYEYKIELVKTIRT